MEPDQGVMDRLPWALEDHEILILNVKVREEKRRTSKEQGMDRLPQALITLYRQVGIVGIRGTIRVSLMPKGAEVYCLTTVRSKGSMKLELQAQNLGRQAGLPRWRINVSKALLIKQHTFRDQKWKRSVKSISANWRGICGSPPEASRRMNIFRSTYSGLHGH